MKILLLPALTLFSVVAVFAQTPAGDFVFIKGGTFTMGSPTTESWRGKDEIQHRVTVGDFYMGKYEVTQKEYREIVGTNPSNFTGDTLPVEQVTWFEAIQYCNARSRKEGLTPAYTVSGENVTWNRAANGYRLPTEAEWEYACRAETITPFNTGNNITVQQADYYGTYPYNIEQNYFSQNKLDVRPGEYRERTVSVGSFAANKWGLYNMHGNVWEWCWDWYGEYSNTASVASATATDPIGVSSGTFRVNRGGGWNDFAKNLRSAYRAATPPNNGSFNLGFRLARNVK
jgi:formylglycine-generating enzyme required for sulfatase activity